MTDRRSAVMLYCEVNLGLGHWVRTAAIAKEFAKKFRTVLVCTGDLQEYIEVPAGVEVVRFPRGAHYPSPTEKSAWGSKLIALLEELHPVALLIEYFPFGRPQSAAYMVPFLRAARAMKPSPLILSSIRDIQEQCRPDQQKFDRWVVQGVNRLVDGVLVHADPNLIQLHDTFAPASQIEVPVMHTGFVAPQSIAVVKPDKQEPTCLISIGGGGGGDSVLRAAVRAAKMKLFPAKLKVRIAAGSLLPKETWQELSKDADGIANLEFLRWIPGLKNEMANAAVSVSRYGYNTALDLMATGARALVIPYTGNGDDEQTFRARRMEALGLVRVLEETSLTPETLAAEVMATRNFEPARLIVDTAGAANTVDLVERMLAQRVVPPVAVPGLKRAVTAPPIAILQQTGQHDGVLPAR